MLLSIDQRTMIYSIFGFSKGGLKLNPKAEYAILQSLRETAGEGII